MKATQTRPKLEALRQQHPAAWRAWCSLTTIERERFGYDFHAYVEQAASEGYA